MSLINQIVTLTYCDACCATILRTLMANFLLHEVNKRQCQIFNYNLKTNSVKIAKVIAKN